ncbi:MAG: class II SORL domain-containing protein [Caldisphaera sp.]|jgi:superoxide reductase|nr:class II SORL domain-containing protein [Caldisphaera sp.]PMP87874.1 MAG: desulfoferrodoxin [Caldisphaera sp.]
MKFGDLIYTKEAAQGEAKSKGETHAPKIEAPEKVKAGEKFEVKVSVGPHPNTVEHSIRQLDLYLNEDGRAFNPIHLAKVFLEPVYSEPILTVTLALKKSGTLYALAYCNLHGVWESSKRIEVE